MCSRKTGVKCGYWGFFYVQIEFIYFYLIVLFWIAGNQHIDRVYMIMLGVDTVQELITSMDISTCDYIIYLKTAIIISLFVKYMYFFIDNITLIVAS